MFFLLNLQVIGFFHDYILLIVFLLFAAVQTVITLTTAFSHGKLTIFTYN